MIVDAVVILERATGGGDFPGDLCAINTQITVRRQVSQTIAYIERQCAREMSCLINSERRNRTRAFGIEAGIEMRRELLSPAAAGEALQGNREQNQWRSNESDYPAPMDQPAALESGLPTPPATMSRITLSLAFLGVWRT